MSDAAFHARFVELFNEQFPGLFRFLDRISGDPDLAADLAQETFIRLYQRGSLPDTPRAWIVSVGMNLLRNAQTTRGRRRRLLTISRAESAHSDPAPAPDNEITSDRSRVRRALDTLPERERQMLLLRAEGFSYRDIAAALSLNEASVGTLLTRARTEFKSAYQGAADVS